MSVPRVVCPRASLTHPVVVYQVGPSHRLQSIEEKILTLSPETLLEQRLRCTRDGRDRPRAPGLLPDEFVAYAFADPVIRGHAIATGGAALRSNGA